MLFDLSAVFSRQQGAFFLRNHLPTSADSPINIFPEESVNRLFISLLRSIGNHFILGVKVTLEVKYGRLYFIN
jgi:hypothetical protein